MRNSKLGSSTTGDGGSGAAAGMRVIVPLQGVVQGRGGLFLGSAIPCALFYFLQLYFKSRDRGGSSAPPPEVESRSPQNASRSSGMQRVHSRLLLSPRGPAAVSSRANAIVGQGEEVKRVEEDVFDEVENPDGVIHLCSTENRLLQDMVQEWLANHMTQSLTGEELSISGITAYQPFDGLKELKIAVAGFMSQALGKPIFSNPSQIVLTSGLAPAIEILIFSLADPGNAFLVPTPYSPDLDCDIKWRTGVEIIPVPCRSSDSFSLSITALDRAFNQAKKRGVKVRGILLSNPSNPVGVVYTRETLYSLLDFAAEKSIHIISNELLLGSSHGSEEFISMAEIIDTEDQEKTRAHIVYGISEDISVTGLNIGAIYSCNNNVTSAAKKLARFSSVSVPTQRILTSMFSDTKFIHRCIKLTKERHERMYVELVNGLKEVGVECMKGRGGYYCWADMSGLIRPYNETGELELWSKLLSIGRVKGVSGSSCHCVEPGWFGFCFSTLKESEIPFVIQRFKKVLDICR